MHQSNNGNHHRGDFQSIGFPDNQQQPQQSPSQDDFLDQILWGAVDLQSNGHKSPWDQPSSSPLVDDPLLLASRLRHHQISPPSSSSKPMVLQLNQQHQQLMVPSMARSGEATLVPLSLANEPRDDLLISNPNSGGVSDGLYNGFNPPPTLQRVGSGSGSGNPQQFSHSQASGGLPSQNYGAQPAVPTASASSGGGVIAPASGTGPPRQRVRARRGQATDPHSIAERLRRERIAERMKALQELVPNANKTDKASMLDEIIDYVKFLQLQVKVLSMSRLGGAAAVAPLVGDISPEGGSGGPRTSVGVSHPSAAAGSGNESLTMTEHQVAKLMEDDMGSAMQYLQGKGLCLMPISLASAISSATGHARAPPPPPLAAALHHHVNAAKQQLLHGGGGSNSSNNIDGSSPPSMSVLTVQSANVTSDAEASRIVKTDACTSVSKA